MHSGPGQRKRTRLGSQTKVFYLTFISLCRKIFCVHIRDLSSNAERDLDLFFAADFALDVDLGLKPVYLVLRVVQQVCIYEVCSKCSPICQSLQRACNTICFSERIKD